MYNYAKEDNIELSINNSYRSVKEQKRIYNKNIDEYIRKEYNKVKSKKLTDLQVQQPGYSKH